MANLSGLLKRRYGKFVNVIPSDDSICAYGKFISQEYREGEAYQVPIQLTNEHGVTFDVTNDAYTLAAARDAVTAQAAINGANIEMIATISRAMIAKMGNGEGASAYQGLDFKMMSLMSSAEHYREVQTLYGGGTGSTTLCSIGTVNAIISGANLAAPIVLNITRATWAAGLWAAQINGLVDIYQSDGITIRESNVTVTAADQSKCRLTLTKAASSVLPVAGDIILMAGSFAKSCYGLQAIAENTGALFGISAATYPSWKCLTYSAGTAGLTRAKILGMAAQLYPNGGREGGKLFVSGTAFADLAEEADALQRFTGNTDEIKRQGVTGLEYKSPIGNIIVQVHGKMKQGHGLYLANGIFQRVGASEITTNLPGTNRFFYAELTASSGSQVGVFTNQAPFLSVPYQCAQITAIQSSADATPS